MITIEPLGEQDLEDLAGLYRQFWNEPSDLSGMERVFRKRSRDPDYLFLGAWMEGRLVGSAMGILCDEMYGRCLPFMVVEDVVVDREYRRRGIGALLMAELEQTAVSRGCTAMLLITEQDRPGAIRFYASLGFNPHTHRGFKKKLVPSDMLPGAPSR